MSALHELTRFLVLSANLRRKNCQAEWSEESMMGEEYPWRA
jgi:hypothetical protein